MIFDKSKFQSKVLQEIHDSVKSSIDAHLQYLDKISNDIRVLEKILSGSGITFIFEYIVEEEIKEREISQLKYYLRKYLIWNPDCKRILYKIEEQNLTKHSNSIDIFLKPLIECKSDTRIKVYPELPQFFKEIIIELKKEHEKEI
jgi:hypothetical protein